MGASAHWLKRLQKSAHVMYRTVDAGLKGTVWVVRGDGPAAYFSTTFLLKKFPIPLVRFLEGLKKSFQSCGVYAEDLD